LSALTTTCQQRVGQCLGNFLPIPGGLLRKRHIRGMQAKQLLDGRHVHELDLDEAGAAAMRGGRVAELDVVQDTQLLLLDLAVIPRGRSPSPGRWRAAPRAPSPGQSARRRASSTLLTLIEWIQRFHATNLVIETVEVDTEKELCIPRKLDTHSTQTGHSFHGKLDTHSTANWTVGA
jgi:hypothetical protein